MEERESESIAMEDVRARLLPSMDQRRDGTDPSHLDKTPLPFEELLSLEARQRLKALFDTRKALEKVFQPWKKDSSNGFITKDHTDISKKLQQEEVNIIIRSFQDPPCLHFEPHVYNANNSKNCSTCGQTSEYHKRDDGPQSGQNGTGLRLATTSDPLQESTTSTAAEATDGEAGDASHHPPHVCGASTATSREALSFGSVQIPRRFVGRPLSFTGEKYKSKYLKFCVNEDAAGHLWSLMTNTWKLKVPSVVFSITGGEIPDKCLEDMKAVTAAIKKITSQAECWIMSDGLNHGTSKYLSKKLQSKGPKDDQRKPDSPVFACATHWGSLNLKELLFGISLPSEFKSSQYFYSMEYKLSQEDNIRVLNPYQAVYLLLDNGLNKADDCALKFRRKFEQFIKETAAKQLRSLEEVTLPIVTLVIGGDDQTLDQVLYSVEHKNPVIIVNRSGDIPNLLSKCFYALEKKRPRTWNEMVEGVWTDDETHIFNHCVEEYEKKNGRTFKCFPGRDAQETVRDKNTLRKIMDRRYYITVIDSNLEDEEEEKNLHCRILQGIYKGYSNQEGIAIALNAGTYDFAEALFLRDVDHRFTEGHYITVGALRNFHRENLCAEEPISKVLDFMCEEEFIIVKGVHDKSILPIIGRILHLLLGPRYKVMYQKDKHSDTIKDTEFKDNEKQMWHLFLLSILSAKPDMTQFFLMQTSAPLGASLLAFKLYSKLAFYSSKVYEEELTTTLRSAAEHFQEVAIEILDNVYNADEDQAYRVLVSRLPFKFGHYVTPLLIADDSEAKDFMVQPCCQTYLQNVWKGNMEVETPDWKSFPVLPPLVVIPWIHFDGTPLKRLDEIKMEMEEEKKKVEGNRRVVKGKKGKKRGMFWKIQSYYTAPVTKFHRWMFAYIGFLALLSYYVLTDLKPFTSVADITVAEWLLIAWELTLIIEEIIQLATMPLVRLNFNLDDVKLNSTIWYYYKRFRTKRPVYAIELYLDSGRWNIVDLTIISLFIVSFALRFLQPLETFQLARIFFAVTIIVCYFRLLRYLSVLETLGPRIIAIQMMLTELLKFLIVLVLFVVSFGVAFQAILNPNQTPSWTTFADILYRTYWEMFGELFLENDMMGMGRSVGDASCQRMASEESLYANGTDMNCYEWAAPVLLGIYLLISAVLLLNLLIAIFGMTYNDIAAMSDKISKYNRYSLVQEFYYLEWLPPPLNVIAHLYRCIIFIVKRCDWKERQKREDCFRLSRLPSDHELQKESTKDVPSSKKLEKKTKEALEGNTSETSEKETSKVDRDDLIEAFTDKRVIDAMTRRIVHGITHNRDG